MTPVGAVVRGAWRNLFRHARRTTITLVAMAFSLGLALFMVALGDGIYSEMIDDAVRLGAGHLTVEHRDYRDSPAVDLMVREVETLRREVTGLRGVRTVKVLVHGQGVAQTGGGGQGVAVMGVEPELEALTSPILSHMVAGGYLVADDTRAVVVGQALAQRLKLDVGKKLVLTTNDAKGALVSELLRVKGIFKMGADEIDGYLVQVPLSFARTLFGLPEDAATQVGVLLADLRQGERIGADLEVRLRQQPVVVAPWAEVLPDLAGYIRLDRGSNLVFQAILLFLSLFTIFNTILMSVLDRTRELAMQIALGAPAWILRAEIALEAAVLGLLGSAGGLLLGGGTSLYFRARGLDLTAFYGGNVSVAGMGVDLVVHPEIRLATFAAIVLGMLVATLALSVIPMRQVSRLHVVEVLRATR